MANPLDRLKAAKRAHDRDASSHYDEVLYEVAGRTKENRSVGKSDIGALIAWKRLRADTPWVKKLMAMPDSEVRAVTARAYGIVRDESLSVTDAAAEGREVLRPLPGCGHGWAIPSTILTACAPERMAVYDRRARKGLRIVLGDESTAISGYGMYMDALESLRRQLGDDWTNRDVDLALFTLGG